MAMSGGIIIRNPENMNPPPQGAFGELRTGTLPPMKMKVPRHSRTKSTIEPEQIYKQLQKYSSNTSSQFALLMCDSEGKHNVVSSNAFSGYLENWLPARIRKEASQVAVSVAEEKAVRRRRDSGVDRRKMPQESKHEPDDDDEDEDWPEEDMMSSIRQGKQIEGYHTEMMLQAPPADDIALRKRSSQVEVQTPRKKKAVPRRQQTTSSSDSGDYPETTNGKLEYKPLHIYDNDAVTTFYMTRLRQMQQLMCKVVSKAWIKVIEPKKQSNFPYNRGDESKPSWWPREVRHKEPDHLMKPERLTLLLTMLRCQKVPISKLESATSEVMVQIPNERIPLLEEIYRVARHEERANRNELPPDTVVYVAASEKIIKRPRSSTRKSATPNLRRQSIASPLSVHSGLGGVTSPISPHAGIGGGVQGDRRQSIQGSPQEIADNNQEMELQSGPSRMGSHDSNLQRVPPAHNPFSGSSVQPVIPTLAHPRGIEYNSNYVSQVSQVSQVSPIQATPQQQQGYGDIYYMVDQQAPPVPQQRHSIPFSGNAPRLNRAQTSPGASVFWSSQHSLNSGMYGPSFNSGNPQQQHSPHGNTQSLSTPSTPATATSFQLPPPPPPHANVPAMQQGQISAQGAHLEMGGMERRAEHQQYALGTQIRPGEHSFTDYLQNDHLASVQENSTEDNNGRLK